MTKILVGKVESSDLIRRIAKDDPLRRDPEIREWLDAPLSEEDREWAKTNMLKNWDELPTEN